MISPAGEWDFPVTQLRTEKSPRPTLDRPTLLEEGRIGNTVLGGGRTQSPPLERASFLALAHDDESSAWQPISAHDPDAWPSAPSARGLTRARNPASNSSRMASERKIFARLAYLSIFLIVAVARRTPTTGSRPLGFRGRPTIFQAVINTCSMSSARMHSVRRRNKWILNPSETSIGDRRPWHRMLDRGWDPSRREVCVPTWGDLYGSIKGFGNGHFHALRFAGSTTWIVAGGPA